MYKSAGQTGDLPRPESHSVRLAGCGPLSCSGGRWGLERDELDMTDSRIDEGYVPISRDLVSTRAGPDILNWFWAAGVIDTALALESRWSFW